MKKGVSVIATTVIGGVIVYLITNYILMAKPNLIFTTTTVPVDGVYYNHVVIQNTGNKNATNIKIDVPIEVHKYSVIKNYQTDIFNSYLNNYGTQFIYDNLTPDSKFELTIASDKVIADDISIAYSEGRAVNALNSGVSTSSFLVVAIYSAVILIFIMLLMIRIYNEYEICQWLYRSDTIVDKKRKSLIMREKTWLTLKENAIRFKILNSDRWSILTNTHIIYKVFQDDFLREFDRETANNLRNIAKKHLNSLIFSDLYSFHWVEDSMKLLYELRDIIPNAIDDSIISSANNVAIVLHMGNQLSSYHELDSKDFQGLDKPKYVQEKQWNYYARLRTAIFKTLIFDGVKNRSLDFRVYPIIDEVHKKL